MSGLLRVTSIHLDGTVTLEDGSVEQLVKAPNGALGLRPHVREDSLAQLDQDIPLPGSKEARAAMKAHFDVSGLDQM